MTDIHVCPLESVKIRGPCKVSTCMWNAKGYGQGCLYNHPMKDDVAQMALLKGIPKSEIKNAFKNRGVLSCAIIRHKYRLWLKDNIEVIKNEDASRAASFLLRKYAHFNVEGWTHNEVWSAVVSSKWRAYSRVMDLRFSQRQVLQIDKKDYQLVKSIVQLLRR